MTDQDSMRFRAIGANCFVESNVKLSHPERVSEERNAVPPSSGYELDVSARG